MGQERGAYRAVKVVLLDGPDFQQLPERARWVFVALKLSFGPTGIEMHYPEALAHELAARTGADVGDVKDALDVLEAAGWIRREANVVWIVGQLQHDPHMTATDKKHRASVWRHVAGLPRLAIVGEFVAAHPEWFLASEDGRALEAAPADVLALVDRRPSEGPPKALPRASEAPKTEDREPKTENRESIVPDGTPPEPDPVPGLWSVWIDELGGKSPQPKLTSQRRKCLRLLYREHLKREEDPPERFRKILRAVKASEHHMSKREYQMPESLFRSEERRDRWYQASLNGAGPSGGQHWAANLP